MRSPSTDLAAWLEALRSEYWAHQTEAEGPAGGRPYLVFESAGRRFALPAEAGRGVVRRPRITRLPGLPEYILGVAGVRGEVVSVVDTNRFLAIPGTRGGPGGYLVLVASGDLRAAFTVDRIVDVVPVSPEEIQPIEAPWAGAPESTVEGQWQAQEPVTVLNPDGLVQGSAVPDVRRQPDEAVPADGSEAGDGTE